MFGSRFAYAMAGGLFGVACVYAINENEKNFKKYNETPVSSSINSKSPDP